EDGVHPDLVPLPERAFDKPIAQYRAYATGQGREVIRAADRRDWDGARDRWLLMGAAYGAMGDLESEVTDAIDRHDGPALSAAARKLPAAVRRAELSPLD